MKLKTIAVAFASILPLTTQAIAQQAFYMANEAVMVTDGDTKVLFDPLYPESYGQYLLVPEAMRAALFAGDDASIVTDFTGVFTVRGGEARGVGAFLTRFLGVPYAMPIFAALAFAMAL